MGHKTIGAHFINLEFNSFVAIWKRKGLMIKFDLINTVKYVQCSPPRLKMQKRVNAVAAGSTKIGSVWERLSIQSNVSSRIEGTGKFVIARKAKKKLEKTTALFERSILIRQLIQIESVDNYVDQWKKCHRRQVFSHLDCVLHHILVMFHG